MKSISIITTIYNTEIWKLKLTFDSIMRQSYFKLIHIIYNDGSDMNDFYNCIEEYKHRVNMLDEPYQVIYIDNKVNYGVDVAHFNCFDMVNSDFFIWLDSGDYLEKDFFNKIKVFIDTHFEEYDCYHFNSHFHYNGIEEDTPMSEHFKLKELKNETQFYNFISKTNWYYHNFLVKTKFYKKMNPFFRYKTSKEHGGYFYDAQIMWLMCLNGCKFYYFDNVFSYIEKPPSSVSKGFKYDFEKTHIVMLSILFDNEIPKRDFYLHQTLAFFENRYIYKILLSKKRKEFKSVLSRQLYYYKDEDLARILYPKKQMYKLFLISMCPLTWFCFIKKNKAIIENRAYFY